MVVDERVFAGEGLEVVDLFERVPDLGQLLADAAEDRALIIALLLNPRVIRRLLERLEAEKPLA